MRPHALRRRSARPVADPALDGLVGRSEELAKAWLLALIEDRPLAGARSIMTAEVSVEGPAMFAALARALGSDRELERIEPGGELERLMSRVGELAGATGPASVSAAVDALRAVLWSAALGRLHDPDGALVGELAERLALIAECVRAAAFRRIDDEQPPGLERALGLAVGRARAEGDVLSLLRVELEDSERMLTFGLEQGGGRPLAPAVRDSIGAGGEVVEGPDGVVWVLAPGADRERADELAAAIAHAGADAEGGHGVPLRLTVGVATLGADDDPRSLIEACEEASFAAAARGIEIARRERSSDPGW